MAENRGIFFEEWRACLQAHYFYVVQIGDKITEPTLHRVLIDAGFSEDEIAQMRQEALQLHEDGFYE